MTLTIYVVDGADAPHYYATQREACELARAESRDADAPVTVSRIRTVPLTKSAILMLVNGLGGFADDTDIIATFVAGRRTRTSSNGGAR